jgi:hypothetical protein
MSFDNISLFNDSLSRSYQYRLYNDTYDELAKTMKMSDESYFKNKNINHKKNNPNNIYTSFVDWDNLSEQEKLNEIVWWNSLSVNERTHQNYSELWPFQRSEQIKLSYYYEDKNKKTIKYYLKHYFCFCYNKKNNNNN